MYDSDEEHGIELPGPWRGSNRDYVYDQEDNFNHNNGSSHGNKCNSDGTNGSGGGGGGGVSFVGDKNYDSPNKVILLPMLLYVEVFLLREWNLKWQRNSQAVVFVVSLQAPVCMLFIFSLTPLSYSGTLSLSHSDSQPSDQWSTLPARLTLQVLTPLLQ